MADAWCVPPFITHEQLVELPPSSPKNASGAACRRLTEFPVRRELVIADTYEEALRGAAQAVREPDGHVCEVGDGQGYRSATSPTSTPTT